jgi:hypothetical protein
MIFAPFFALGKSAQVSVLEAESFRRQYGSTNFVKKAFFSSQ